MAALIQAGRQFSYAVARRMGRGEGSLAASMVKAYVCRAAEWVTREAMQLHGGMGYAEEFPVSRYFVDARVLSIFEGADETLCLRVIAPRLAEAALAGDAVAGVVDLRAELAELAAGLEMVVETLVDVAQRLLEAASTGAAASRAVRPIRSPVRSRSAIW